MRWCMSLLLVPSHLYELLPITVLIGTIFVMARLAQSSEFTICAPAAWARGARLRSLLLKLGLAFFVCCSPLRSATTWRRIDRPRGATAQGPLPGPHHHVGQTGAWLKETPAQRQPMRSTSAPCRPTMASMLACASSSSMPRATAVGMTEADTLASFAATGAGNLDKCLAHRVGHSAGKAPRCTAMPHTGLQRSLQQRPHQLSLAHHQRRHGLGRACSSRAHEAPWTCSSTSATSNANGQSAQRYEIEFWRKVFYPLSCLVMVVLALPFAYLHFRSAALRAMCLAASWRASASSAEQRVWLRIGNLQNWSPVAHRRGAWPDLFRALAGRLRLAGAAPLIAFLARYMSTCMQAASHLSCFRPRLARSAVARAHRSRRRPHRACAHRPWCAVPTWSCAQPDLPEAVQQLVHRAPRQDHRGAAVPGHRQTCA